MLAWSAPSGTTPTGYRVYYGTASGTYAQPAGSGISAGTTPTFTVGGLQSGTTYYFAVTDVDATGRESPLSNEVSKTIP